MNGERVFRGIAEGEARLLNDLEEVLQEYISRAKEIRKIVYEGFDYAEAAGELLEEKEREKETEPED